MVTITRIAFTFSIIFSIVMIVSFALPKKYKIQESVFVEKSGEDIYTIVNNLKTWQDWTVWNTTQLENTQIRYSEQTVGLNAMKTIIGEGSDIFIQITETKPNELVQYKWALQDKDGNPQLEVEGAIQIMDGGQKPSKVTWIIGGNWGSNPIFRYVGLVLKQKMQKELKENLEGLKKVKKTTSEYQNPKKISLLNILLSK